MQTAQETPTKGTRLLTIAEIVARTKLARSTVYSLTQRGLFPRPIRLGKHSRWLEREVEQFLSGLAAARAA